jgi:hypothetical protein
VSVCIGAKEFIWAGVIVSIQEQANVAVAEQVVVTGGHIIGVCRSEAIASIFRLQTPVDLDLQRSSRLVCN